MMVRVKFVGGLRRKVKMEDLWMPLRGETTLKEILAKLEKERGIKVKLEDSSIVILVNGRRIEFIGGLNANLKHMDEVVIMPAIAGGIRNSSPAK